MTERLVKCRRTACANEIDALLGGGIHRGTGDRYCPACARAINSACGEEIVILPKFKTDAPNTQQIPKKREP